MTKLTPSEARRLIDKLHHNQTKEHGISILEEKYLAALEIALPVLQSRDSITDTYRQIENDGSEKAAMIIGGKWVTAREGDPTGEIRRLMELCVNPKIENDGWIDWKGGNSAEIPVDEAARVELRWSNGSTSRGRASNFGWANRVAQGFNSIIAYRVIENDGGQ